MYGGQWAKHNPSNNYLEPVAESNTYDFNQSTTFRIHRNKWYGYKDALESLLTPGKFISTVNGNLRLVDFADNDNYKDHSSWWIKGKIMTKLIITFKNLSEASIW